MNKDKEALRLGLECAVNWPNLDYMDDSVMAEIGRMYFDYMALPDEQRESLDDYTDKCTKAFFG